MRRWHLYLATSIIALVVALGVWHVREERAQQRREFAYRKSLRSYSEVLRTGTTRKQVENYFSSRNIPFRQLCCVSVKEFSKGVDDYAYDDLVKIGQEDVPWVCRANNVYIAFQFFGSGRDSSATARPADTLKDISIYHHLDGCM